MMEDLILILRQNLENIYNTQREMLVLMRDMAAILEKAEGNSDVR